ncbi:MAG: PHP domain-containing protein [Clostridiales bacterium]|jgi:predicted metal-dependent phosphoesterase TrpH|nr:PHP domain-containing protein [Clostridiales bacterium]
MDKPFADLHVHSFYSDGSMSPDEIMEAAVSNDVGLLAIADHNALDGSIKIRKLCKDNGIQYIPAVEINTLEGGTDFHILAYGFDIENVEFTEFIKHTRFLLDETSVKLIELMQSDYSDISLEDYMKYTHDRRLGGFKALSYFISKGLTSNLKEGMQFFPKYGMMDFSKTGFSTIAATAYRIKSAGGYAVLAHPGNMIDTSDINNFKDELMRIVSLGLNGIECYYPSHSEAITKVCIEICDKHDLLITAGSDCHGSFMKTRVGEMDINLSKLRLKELLANEY